MSLESGTCLGPYEVTAQIGAGGMGEVYRARDTKLNRDVALKVLPEAVADDPERLARFRREAQVLAALNHPNIAAIYGLEDSGETHALVLELVEGPTLQDRIAQGAIPLDEALPIAKQIAEALEAAHEQGIIHRDLKPANIKVTPEGVVKVLDFGLAKALDASVVGRDFSPADLAESPTMSMTAAATRAGLILGTAAYMSPEQARGKPVDKRTDIWAFGCVLYEMFTGGARLFEGDTISDTLASVLKSAVDFAALPDGTPSRVRTLLRRCLEGDRKRRLQAIGDARLELEDALTGEPEPVAPPGAAASSARRLPWVAATIVAGLAALVLAVVHLGEVAPHERTLQLSVSVPEDQAVAFLELSPDAQRLVLVLYGREGDEGQIYVRSLDSDELVRLPGTAGPGRRSGRRTAASLASSPTAASR